MKKILEKNFKTNSKFVLFVFSISTFIIITNLYNWFDERTLFQYSDWLINYQGGFTRRGLIGEFFFQIHNITHVDLDKIILFFVGLLYLSFLYLIYLPTKKINLNFLNTLIVFSPLSFLNIVYLKTLVGRKEILLFSAFAIFLHFYKKIKFENVKYFIIFITVLTSLSHSGLLFYMPYLVFFYIYLNQEKGLKKLLLHTVPVFLFFLFILILNIYSVLNPPDINKIFFSVEDFSKNLNETYIKFLDFGVKGYSHDKIIYFDFNKYLIWYPIYAIFGFTPLILGFYYLNNFLNKKIHLKYFLLISFFCTLPIFYLGTDWGRYLMINYIMMQLIYFYLVLYKNISFNKNFFFKKEKLLVFFIITIFFYSFFWTVPHCCYPEFKSIYAHPFEKIFN